MSVQQTELQLDVLLATYWGTSTDEEITRLWRLNRTNLTLISTNFVSRDKWILKHEMPAVSLKWHLRGDLLRSGYAAGPASGWSLKALSSKQKSSVCVDVQSFACCRDSHVWDMLALAYNKWCTLLLGVSDWWKAVVNAGCTQVWSMLGDPQKFLQPLSKSISEEALFWQCLWNYV